MRNRIAWLGLGLALGACGDDGGNAGGAPDEWRVLASGFPEAVLAVDGTSRSNVFVVGANQGQGPLIERYDGTRWERIRFDQDVSLWWVDVVDETTAFAAGTRATVLRIRDGVPERLPTPGLSKHTVFGLWARSESDVYAVGAVRGRDGFIWRYDGTDWTELELPRSLASPALGRGPALFKVWGNDEAVWVVGGQGLVMRSTDGTTFDVVESGTNQLLFTVHGGGSEVGFVGGGTEAVLLEAEDEALVAREVPPVGIIQGLYYSGDGSQAVATGRDGLVFMRSPEGWERENTELSLGIESLHAAWIDPEGGIWAVGGNVLSDRLDEGVVIVRGVSAEDLPPPEVVQPPPPECPIEEVDPTPDKSIARRWIEQNLNAIRRDIPRPTVHARNLFHVSAAMYDIWAATEDGPSQVFIDETFPPPADLDAFRQTAMSYAAYRILTHRYEPPAVGGEVTVDCLDRFMDVLGLDPDDTTAEGDSAVAFGNRVGAVLIEFGRTDGANEAADYVDPDGYEPVNPPLVVDGPGTVMNDPARWQELDLAVQVTQNGINIGSGVVPYIGPHWRDVTPFALVRPAPDAPYYDVGDGPTFTPDIIEQVVQVIDRTSLLDVDLLNMIDTSPRGYGNNSLGADDGGGYDENPVTGEPYAPVMVNQSDFGRIMAEYWADGPNSETPPGHWNTIAHETMDRADFDRRFEGEGEPLGELEYDVKLHLALNGGLHDAAITAWELKRIFESSRPVSLVRYMAQLGQSTETDADDYDPMGLPLRPGLIERITEQSSQPGERHAALYPYVGELALRSWRGEPGDPVNEYSGVAWIRALEWVPYQRETFVTPAFPGFTSGHSTFSRAAAEVMALFTGSPYFPGGFYEIPIRQNQYLTFEEGPTTDVPLQFASYYDCADQAGQSRIWGGIHIVADDYIGRETGSQTGITAFEAAKQYFQGLR